LCMYNAGEGEEQRQQQQQHHQQQQQQKKMTGVQPGVALVGLYGTGKTDPETMICPLWAMKPAPSDFRNQTSPCSQLPMVHQRTDAVGSSTAVGSPPAATATATAAVWMRGRVTCHSCPTHTHTHTTTAGQLGSGLAPQAHTKSHTRGPPQQQEDPQLKIKPAASSKATAHFCILTRYAPHPYFFDSYRRDAMGASAIYFLAKVCIR
jgi:hypothetical protein